MNLIIIITILISIIIQQVSTNPCEITTGNGMTSARIEFDENTLVNTTIFKLPFDGDVDEIDEIKFISNELNDSQLKQFFRLNFKKLVLNSHYDLDITEIDFIELLFTCTTKPNKKNIQFRNTFILYITIIDVNDKSPEFIGTPYKFSVKELTPIGTIIYSSIKAIDRDMQNRPNSQISFSIAKGPFSDFFEFPLTTKGELAVSKLIHYDLFSKVNLTIIAQDHGTPHLSSNTTIQIDVIDIDDKDPVFTHNFYKGFVARNEQPGSFINMTTGPIKAYDQDLGINMDVRYSLNTNPENLFEINELTGEIKLKDIINDYDKFEYNLVVKATQIDNSLRSAMSMISVSVIDINLYAPKFDYDTYETSIQENAKQDKIVLEVHATDKDNNRIEYSILNNHESPFMIDKYKGIIRVNGRLDYEMRPKYNLEILAKDGNYSSKCIVKIKVVNLIDKAPNFEYDYYNFKIKIPYTVYIGQIKANDIENTANMSYKIKFNNENDSKLFCITQTGTIYICSSVLNPSLFDSNLSNNKNSLEDLLDMFKDDEYKFNVSASIYSNDLNIELENSVECKIQIESKKINKILEYNPDMFNKSREILNLQALKPNVFIKDHLFKDIQNVNIFIIIIGLVLSILIICISILMWFKCRQVNGVNKRNTKTNSNLDYLNQTNQIKRLDLGIIRSDLDKNNICSLSSSSRSSSDCGGIKSTSSSKTSTSGISCSSGFSTNYLDNQNKYLNDNSPISKVTILTDYLNLQSKNSKLDPIRVSCYSDLLSSAASTIKNREIPIMIKHYEESNSIPISIPICIEQINEQNDNDCCIVPFNESPKLLSFLPPVHYKTDDGQYNNYGFNNHEPLSANSELNLENSEINLKSVYYYEDLTNNFQNNLNNCNESLAKLVNIMNNTSNNINSKNNDSSLVSASIDNYTNNTEDYDDYLYDINLTETTTSTNDETEVRHNVNRLIVSDNFTNNKLHDLTLKSKPPIGFRDPINISKPKMFKTIKKLNQNGNLNEKNNEFLITKCSIISIDKNEPQQKLTYESEIV